MLKIENKKLYKIKKKIKIKKKTPISYNSFLKEYSNKIKYPEITDMKINKFKNCLKEIEKKEIYKISYNIDKFKKGKCIIELIEENKYIKKRVKLIEHDLVSEYSKEKCTVCYDNLGKSYVKLLCGHEFHYDCIVNSYRYARNSMNRECPYCRYKGSWIPLLENATPEKGIHKEYRRTYTKKKISHCKGIIQSGKNSGKQCSNRSKHNGYCGKHFKQILTI